MVGSGAVVRNPGLWYHTQNANKNLLPIPYISADKIASLAERSKAAGTKTNGTLAI